MLFGSEYGAVIELGLLMSDTSVNISGVRDCSVVFDSMGKVTPHFDCIEDGFIYSYEYMQHFLMISEESRSVLEKISGEFVLLEFYKKSETFYDFREIPIDMGIFMKSVYVGNKNKMSFVPCGKKTYNVYQVFCRSWYYSRLDFLVYITNTGDCAHLNPDKMKQMDDGRCSVSFLVRRDVDVYSAFLRSLSDQFAVLGMAVPEYFVRNLSLSRDERAENLQLQMEISGDGVFQWVLDPCGSMDVVGNIH